jgi:flagellar assembly protein FliH
MTSSNFKKGPPPKDGAKGSVYSRFIPREELSSFSSWNPDSLSGSTTRSGTGAPAEDPVPPAEVLAQQLTAARQGGYQDGYRDGMAALEGFKQGFATQITAQIGRLMESHGVQLDALQQQVAQTVAKCALSLAREVVRSELALRPELVATVAQEAVDTLLLSARHITVRVHPDDQPLVAQGAAEVVQARSVRLIGDATIARGGCLIESDIASVDGTVPTRWRRVAASLGSDMPWSAADATVADAGFPGDDAEPAP